MALLPEIATLGNEKESANTYEALMALEVPYRVITQPWKWNVVIAPLSPPRKTSGGIILADDTADAQDYLTAIGRLLIIGPQAMKGKRLLGDNLDGWIPQCGDWVSYGRYAGVRSVFRPTGLLFVTCNDDDINGVIPGDPREYKILV